MKDPRFPNECGRNFALGSERAPAAGDHAQRLGYKPKQQTATRLNFKYHHKNVCCSIPGKEGWNTQQDATNIKLAYYSNDCEITCKAGWMARLDTSYELILPCFESPLDVPKNRS